MAAQVPTSNQPEVRELAQKECTSLLQETREDVAGGAVSCLPAQEEDIGLNTIVYRRDPATNLSTTGPFSITGTQRENTARIAESYIGSKDWNFDVAKDNFDVGTNKGNKFVYDVTTEAGASPELPNGNRIGQLFGQTGSSPPTAEQWADPNYEIPGWEVLDEGEAPARGDVAAYRFNFSDATGHVAIVTDEGHTVGTSGANHSIARTEFGFDPTLSHDQPIVFRRYVGN